MALTPLLLLVLMVAPKRAGRALSAAAVGLSQPCLMLSLVRPTVNWQKTTSYNQEQKISQQINVQLVFSRGQGPGCGGCMDRAAFGFSIEDAGTAR